MIKHSKTNKSFYDWCIENNRKDVLDRWDYKLNNISPEYISFGSTNLYYFKCPQNLHKSELYQIVKITRNDNTSHVICKYCNSFAQWNINNIGVDFLEKYWDYEKNIIDAWNIMHGSHKKVWIKCQEKDYHGSYEISANNFTMRNQRCSYCASKNKVHPKDSFAQYHIDNTDKDFIKKYWSNKNILNPYELSVNSHVSIFIKCHNTNYHEDYKTTPYVFSLGVRCPYCDKKKVHKFDSLAYSNPEVFEIWSDKNKYSPYEYSPHANRKIWLKCKNGHDDYCMNINNALRCEFNCPQCTKESTESNLQKKVSEYIINILNYEIYKEYKCTIVPKNPKTKSLMPFDNEIEILKLIIEVHGRQHYDINSYTGFWKDSVLTQEEQLHKRKLYDRYKRFIAHHYGYYYLEIPYWMEKDKSYKTLIDIKIRQILNIKEKIA